jgi:apolipoprotein N-acyltransferase
MAAVLGKTARDGGFDLFVGGGTTEVAADKTLVDYNSAYFFDRNGAIAGRYDKMILLPFGEHIPLSDTFPALKQMIDGPSDCRPGAEATVFRGQGYAFTSPICYEAILDAQMRLMARGDLFVNITNDGWFGDTAAPHQHGMLVAAQATELGRPILRIAFTGVSFLAEPTGAILDETRPFTEVAEVRALRLGKVDTLYLRGGWLFPWACVVLSAAALVFAWRKKKS